MSLETVLYSGVREVIIHGFQAKGALKKYINMALNIWWFYNMYQHTGIFSGHQLFLPVSLVWKTKIDGISSSKTYGCMDSSIVGFHHLPSVANLPEKCSATHMRSSFTRAVSFIQVPNVLSILVTFLGLIRDLIRHSEGQTTTTRSLTQFSMILHSLKQILGNVL